jgi:hypothetical protein
MATLLHEWTFEEDDRDGVVLSDATKIRLGTAAAHVLRLRPDATGAYPTAADLSARLPAFTPTAWEGAVAVQVVPAAKPPTGTSVGLRLREDGVEKRWIGNAWEEAGAGEWNTEAEFNAGLASGARAAPFQLVVNLRTTDSTKTPAVRAVKLAWSGTVDWGAGLLFDTLIAALQTITAVAEIHTPELEAGADRILLSSCGVEPADAATKKPGYLFTAVELAQDLGADAPRPNIASGFTAPETVTLAAEVAAGRRVRLRMRYAPTIAWATHPDYTEVASWPSITIEDFAEDQSQEVGPDETIAPAGGSTLRFPAPVRKRIRCALVASAERGRDLARLVDALDVWLKSNPTLRIEQIDGRLRMRSAGGAEYRATAAASPVQVARRTVYLESVYTWPRESESAFPLTRVVFGDAAGNVKVTVEKP